MAHRSFSVSQEHYAAGWKSRGEINDPATVNALAITYATTPDGPEREAQFLELVRAFDSYFRKYVNMVINGHLPSQRTPAGKDAAQFLKTLLPKDQPVTQMNLSGACRTLHLAFKQMTTDDVYDVMVMCFLRTVRRYDPFYTDKVRQVCEVIHAQFPADTSFTADAVSRSVGFAALGCLRLLVRRKFLESVPGKKKKVVGYKRGTQWPPPQSFFDAGPVGFTYFAQMWFRYYLNDHITQAMGELEAQDGILQLDHRVLGSGHGSYGDRLVPSARGAYTDREGITWAADTTLMTSQQDVSEMTDAWVCATDDKLFAHLTPKERKILQLVFRDEQTWTEIATVLLCTPQWAKAQFDEIMGSVQQQAGAEEEPLEDEDELFFKELWPVPDDELEPQIH